MADQERPHIPAPPGRTANKLHDPTPQRRKYVIDLLFKFLNNQITMAQLTGISQKDLYQLSEVGHVKLRHGRTAEAKKIFECLVKMDSKNPFFHSCMGSVFQKMGRYVDAVFEYSEALKFKKDDVASMVNRGEIYLIHKNYKKAAEDFRNAILLDPVGKNLFSNRARSLVIAIKRSLQVQKGLVQGAKAPPIRPKGLRPGGQPSLARRLNPPR